MPKFLSRQIL
ncbi:unnamed protein product, partial [Adineta steineri]